MNAAAMGRSLALARSMLVAAAAEAVAASPELADSYQRALATIDDALDAARAGDMPALQRYTLTALRAVQRAQDAAAHAAITRARRVAP